MDEVQVAGLERLGSRGVIRHDEKLEARDRRCAAPVIIVGNENDLGAADPTATDDKVRFQ